MKKKEVIELIEEVFPSNWLDPRLTGPENLLGEMPWGCPDIERLVGSIKNELKEKVERFSPSKPIAKEKE